MTFFVALNPKRQQSQWYEEPKQIIGAINDEVLKDEFECEALDLSKFADSYKEEKEKIRKIRFKKRCRQSGESLHLMLTILEDE